MFGHYTYTQKVFTSDIPSSTTHKQNFKEWFEKEIYVPDRAQRK